MPRDQPIRVAMMFPVFRNSHAAMTRGIIRFSSRGDRWRLVGSRREPTQSFDQIDLSDVDGIIGYFNEREWADAVLSKGISAVNLSTSIEDLPLPRASNDDRAIGAMGASHLLERGFVNLGWFGPTNQHWFSRCRQRGFKDVVEGHSNRHCHVFDHRVHRTAENWLKGLSAPIAIMAEHDVAARDLVDTAHAVGLRVPEDLTVLGVDNDLWMTELAEPTISSVAPNWIEVGYRAAQLLDGVLAGEAHDRPIWVPPVGIVTRQSTDIVVTDDSIVRRAMQVIQERLATGVTIENILEELVISRRSLERHFKRALGRTPHAALRRAQVDRARKMLIETDLQMAQIAKACGFGNPKRFFIVFKGQTGLTPGQYRRQHAV